MELTIRIQPCMMAAVTLLYFTATLSLTMVQGLTIDVAPTLIEQGDPDATSYLSLYK